MRCITCGAELHPERAKKYDYCMAPECQQKNAKGLTMVAIGMNKAADEFMILDDQAREDLASGKYRDQRRGSFGPVPSLGGSMPARAPEQRAQPVSASRVGPAGTAPARRVQRRAAVASRSQPGRSAASRSAAPSPWSRSEEKLALLYNEQGMRPEQIAEKLGLTCHLVTQIILAAKNRGKA